MKTFRLLLVVCTLGLFAISGFAQSACEQLGVDCHHPTDGPSHRPTCSEIGINCHPHPEPGPTPKAGYCWAAPDVAKPCPAGTPYPRHKHVVWAGDGEHIRPADGYVWRKPGEQPADLSVISQRKAEEKELKDTVANTQAEFDKMNSAWMSAQRRLIAERLASPNPWCESIVKSLKIKEPPLPYKKLSELQPGDVLLVHPRGDFNLSDPGSFFDSVEGFAIQGADMASSWERKSQASHTLIFIKEVDGKRLFLDNRKKEGLRIKTREQILKEYGKRDMDVAQPLRSVEAGRVWSAAREVEIKEIKAIPRKSNNLIDKTGYGLYGNDNMVCSETSHWILFRAGYATPDSDSPIKKLFGVYFGPTNFYDQEQHFLVTPLVLH